MTICEYFIENLKQGIKISQSPIKSGVHSLQIFIIESKKKQTNEQSNKRHKFDKLNEESQAYCQVFWYCLNVFPKKIRMEMTQQKVKRYLKTLRFINLMYFL